VSLSVGKVPRKCLLMRALVVFDDFGHRHLEFAKWMGDRVRDGKFRDGKKNDRRAGPVSRHIRWPVHRQSFRQTCCLGSVDVHRVLITDAASETNAVKLSSVLQ